MNRFADLHWATPQPKPLFRIVSPFVPILWGQWHPYPSSP